MSEFMALLLIEPFHQASQLDEAE